jgi:CheY-like chemotaxis protein
MLDISTYPCASEQLESPIHQVSASRILVVEDSLLQQKLMVILLRQRGYNIGTANNGLDAIFAIRLMWYDVILMDCQLPLMDGLQATQFIRQSEQRTGKPIIIVGISSSVSGQQCLKAGMNDYLPKPVNFSILSAMLERWDRLVQQYHQDFLFGWARQG